MKKRNFLSIDTVTRGLVIAIVWIISYIGIGLFIERLISIPPGSHPSWGFLLLAITIILATGLARIADAFHVSLIDMEERRQ